MQMATMQTDDLLKLCKHTNALQDDKRNLQGHLQLQGD